MTQYGFKRERAVPLIEQLPQQDGTCGHDNAKATGSAFFYALGFLSGLDPLTSCKLAHKFYKQLTALERNESLKWVIEALKDLPPLQIDEELYIELFHKVRTDPRIEKSLVKKLKKKIEAIQIHNFKLKKAAEGKSALEKI